jgi:adenine-specific DNA-methyltransferase
MSSKNKTKLELTWIGKDKRPKLEPRILLEDPSKSYHASHKVTENDIFDNKLIFGDNLLALKALEQEYAGKVKCVFIDPPYNTGNAFEHYDDGVEHSIWLSLIRDRIEILKNLLSIDGSIWITLDDNESHYLKVLCDEIFGRSNFVSNVVWQKKYSKQNDAKWLSTSHDHLLVYAKNKINWKPNKLERSEEQLKGYKNIDNDPRGLWQSVVYTCSKSRQERPNLYYPIVHPKSGNEIYPDEKRVWAYDKKRHEMHKLDDLLWWGENFEKDKPRLKSFLKKVGNGIVPDTLWLRSDSGDNQEAKREVRVFNEMNIFDTPKPERLIKKVLEVATSYGDLVLDSFAGSGTTGSVAQKMGRKWIMIELGEHCHTHIIPRLHKVISGEDEGGITKSVNWQGGGGFRYYRLAPSLLEQDRWGRWVISKDYDAAMLAEAICKLEGFTYSPSESEWWNHGYSTEHDRIYVTTQTLSLEQLQSLSEEVGEGRSLLVCCSAFRCKTDSFQNLTLKKIPKMVLSRCEYGHDDYSLNVENLPMQEKQKVDPAQGSFVQGDIFDDNGQG